MKKISVIIPCYNVEKEIDRCIQSLVDQTILLSQMELIFVDDASEDATMEKLSKWEEQYPESILVIHCEENGKQGTARNIGMQYATGEYIGFVDSDDYVEPEMYQEMCRIADQEQVDVVGCLYVREEENGSVVMDAQEREDAGRSIRIKSEEDRKRLMTVGLLEKYHDEIEMGFLQLYFINTIRILFVRFREIPYDIIYTMQDNVKELFPDYQKNPYLEKLPQLQRELLKMVEIPLDKEKIDILAQGYRKVLRDWQKENGMLG